MIRLSKDFTSVPQVNCKSLCTPDSLNASPMGSGDSCALLLKEHGRMSSSSKMSSFFVAAVTWLIAALAFVPAVVPAKERLEVEDLRIVNGREVAPGTRTYQVSLQQSFDGLRSSASHFCGGTLVDESWVVTAAHCARATDMEHVTVVTGTNNIKDQDNPMFRVKKAFINDFDDKTKRNDIALLHIEPLSEMGSRLASHPSHPVRLAPADFSPYDRTCVVSGWGRMADGGKVPEKLMEVNVTVLDNENCERMLKTLPWDRSGESMICAGGADKDACQGDSGGPLVCNYDGEDRLCGITSWGVGCATEGVPGVYCNTRSYIPWIQDIVMTETGQYLDI